MTTIGDGCGEGSADGLVVGAVVLPEVITLPEEDVLLTVVGSVSLPDEVPSGTVPEGVSAEVAGGPEVGGGSSVALLAEETVVSVGCGFSVPEGTELAPIDELFVSVSVQEQKRNTNSSKKAVSLQQDLGMNTRSPSFLHENQA